MREAVAVVSEKPMTAREIVEGCQHLADVLLTDSACISCVDAALDAARAEGWRAGVEATIAYLVDTLAKNHPHLADAYQHAATNIRDVVQPPAAELRIERAPNGIGPYVDPMGMPWGDL